MSDETEKKSCEMVGRALIVAKKMSKEYLKGNSDIGASIVGSMIFASITSLTCGMESEKILQMFAASLEDAKILIGNSSVGES